jgi:hypothetical protein
MHQSVVNQYSILLQHGHVITVDSPLTHTSRWRLRPMGYQRAIWVEISIGEPKSYELLGVMGYQGIIKIN